MTSRRTLKAAEAIREVVAMAILAEIKDPRVRNATVTRVEVSGDMRWAKVYISVMADPCQQPNSESDQGDSENQQRNNESRRRDQETQEQLTLRGLQSAAGFLQAKCAKRIDTRYTPRLQFQIDEGVKKSVEVNQLLKEIFPDGVAESESEHEA